jgi:hypothetical protein
MLLDRMGYILAEGFTLLVIVSFTKGILYLRRRPDRRRFLSRADRELLFRPLRLPPSAPERFCRYVMTFVLTVIAATAEMILIAPLGAAILTGALLVTSTAIVQRCLSEV